MNDQKQPPIFEPFVPARAKGQVPAPAPQAEPAADAPAPKAKRQRKAQVPAETPAVEKKARKARGKNVPKIPMDTAFKIAGALKLDDVPLFDSFRGAMDQLSKPVRKRIQAALNMLYVND